MTESEEFLRLFKTGPRLEKANREFDQIYAPKEDAKPEDADIWITKP